MVVVVVCVGCLLVLGHGCVFAVDVGVVLVFVFFFVNDTATTKV